MASGDRQLVRSRENWVSAGLLDIVHDALEPFGIPNGRVERIVVKGENIPFSPKSALALGIVFNELATNAVKYGALANEAGSILVEWTTESTLTGGRLILHWREKDGPPVSTPSHRGFGSRVIERSLDHELGGTANLDFRPDGLICAMTIPIPRPPVSDKLLSGRRILVVETKR